MADDAAPENSAWWHRVKNTANFAYDIGRALLLTGVILLSIGTVASAMFGKSLVVEAFSVPKDFADNGLTGQVLASHVADNLAFITRRAQAPEPGRTATPQPRDTPVKVQVSAGGISLEQAYNFIRAHLGDDRYVSGEVYQDNGRLAFRLRMDETKIDCGRSGQTTVNLLVGQMADCIAAHAEPDIYARYLENYPPGPENFIRSLAQAETYFRAAAASHDRDEKAWGLEGEGFTIQAMAETRFKAANAVVTPLRASGLYQQAADKLAQAVEIFRDAYALHRFALIRQHLVTAEMVLQLYAMKAGDDTRQFAADEDLLAHWNPRLDLHEMSEEYNLDHMPSLEVARRAEMAEFQGDYRTAAQWRLKQLGFKVRDETETEIREDLAEERANMHDQRSWTALKPSSCSETAVLMGTALERWSQLSRLCPVSVLEHPACQAGDPMEGCDLAQDRLAARILLAHAMSADTDRAVIRGLIAKTSRTCDDCLRIQGIIEAGFENWGAAENAFRAAALHAPALPATYSDWARMNLAHMRAAKAGTVFDTAAHDALAHARQAYVLAPNYADPLETWGEVLMLQNRSDLAVQRFALACPHAPAWTRLQDNWAMALGYSGRTTQAQKLRHIAAALPLPVQSDPTYRIQSLQYCGL